METNKSVHKKKNAIKRLHANHDNNLLQRQ